MIYSALTMYMSLNLLQCPHPAAQVELKLEIRDLNLDQLSRDEDQNNKMQCHGNICFTLYAPGVLPSDTVLCSISSS